MPTYEYICDACGREYEKFQSITAKPDRVCPSCKARKVRRKIGIGSGVIFKGSGFYETDYRSDDYAKAAKAERQGGDAPAPKTTPGGDTATASASSAPTAAGAAAAAATPAPAPKDAATTKPAAPAERSATKAVHPSRVGRGKGNLKRRGR
jgi:putative FmdB family regulatory protein